MQKITRFKFTSPKVASGQQKVFITDSDIAIYCGRPSDSFWPEHVHGHVQIMLTYAQEGGELVWRDAKKKEIREVLRSGQVYFIGPKALHSLRWGRGDLIIFYLAPRYATELEKLLGTKVCVQPFARMAGHDFVISPLMDLLRHWCKNLGERDYPLLTISARETIDRLVEACYAAHKDEKGRHDQLTVEQLATVLDYMNNHLHEGVQLAKLSRLIFRSPKHFMRLFKNTTGVAAISYFRQLKMRRAEELLASGSHTIAEVVSELGFCDQSLLNRYFRKYLNTTPRRVIQDGTVQKMATFIQGISRNGK